MWKDYSVGFIRNNRASSISIMVAAFISSLFLSFLCSMFYNVWVYEVEKIVLEEGDWQGRLTGVTDAGDLLTIENFANVEKAVVNEALSGEQGIVADIYFHNVRTVYKDMPMIAKRLGLDEKAVSCHALLLSRYLIHDPQDETPPLLLTLYLVILSLVSLSLILIIHNSFAVSMNARVHQFGILSSIGATPVQIRICLMQEAAVLCALPILSGNIIGIVLSLQQRGGLSTLRPACRANCPLVFITILSINSCSIVVSFNRAVLCLASCRKIKQDDAVGSNQGNGCNRAEEKKAFSNSLNFIWYRGGTGRKCAEGAKESAAHFHIVSDLVIYGVYNDAVFFFSYRSQHQIHLFSALSGCLGYYDNNKRYQN